MRYFWLCLIISLALGAYYLNSYCKNHTGPNVYINQLNVSRLTKRELISLMYQELNKPLTVKIKNRNYTYSYKALGLEIDQQKISDELFTTNSLQWLKTSSIKKIYSPSLVFGSTFDQFVEKTVYDFSLSREEIIVNNQEKELTFQNNEEKFQIDKESLKKLVLNTFSKKKTIEPKLIALKKTETPKNIVELNLKIKDLYAQAITVYLQNQNQKIAFTLNSEILKKLLIISYTDKLIIDIDRTYWKDLLSEKTIALKAQYSDFSIDSEKLFNELKQLIQSRFVGIPQSILVQELKQSANTNGDKAKKYIEIDLSQQKMYLWDNGLNIAIHTVSSGLYYKTPAGIYKILNKAINAYSDIYNVWMPYWMAFSLDKTVNAYLGIHELPYWVSIDGQQIRRPRDFLGSPHTGGCVSLDVGIAERVYQWADIGTPVYIFE